MEEWCISSEYDFLKSIVEEERATGRSTRIVDRIIQDFFEKPIGTIIPIYETLFILTPFCYFNNCQLLFVFL